MLLQVGALSDPTPHRPHIGTMGASEVQVPSTSPAADTAVGGAHRATPTIAVCSLEATAGVWPNNGSRMRRESHVRFCERLAVRLRRATHLVAGFEHEADARRFLDMMRTRLEEFALTLHPEKTRLIEFGRHAGADRKKRGLGKPGTFNFLGFTFISGKDRRGNFQLKRKTRRDRMTAKLREVKEELRRRMHQPIPEQGKWLRQVVSGFFNYHAVSTNSRALAAFRHHVTVLCNARCGAAARRIAVRGTGWRGLWTTGSPDRVSFIHGRACALPSDTRGGSRMRESRTYGSVRGAPSNGRPYRDPAGVLQRSEWANLPPGSSPSTPSRSHCGV